MTLTQFMRTTERDGWYVVDKGELVGSQSIGTSITIKGDTFTFRYRHIKHHKFKHRQFHRYDKAYRYLMDSVASEVIDA